jgi:hypothetical protein
VVGVAGFEPATPASRTPDAPSNPSDFNHLSEPNLPEQTAKPGVFSGPAFKLRSKSKPTGSAAASRAKAAVAAAQASAEAGSKADPKSGTTTNPKHGDDLLASLTASTFGQESVLQIPSNWDIREMPIARISIPARLRDIDDQGVTAMMISLAAGLIQPPLVRDDGLENGGVVLVAGRQRVEAARRLGWSTIRCRVLTLNDQQARLVEIDENLVRTPLTAAETALALVERKGIFESLHGRAKARGAHAANGAMGRAHDATAKLALAFTADAARATGKSARSIQRAIQRVTDVGDAEIKRVVRTSLDRGAELDALAALPASRRAELIEQAEAGNDVSAVQEAAADEAASVTPAAESPPAPDVIVPAEAADRVHETAPAGADEKPVGGAETAGLAALKSAWRVASESDRASFLSWVEGAEAA